DPRRSSRQRPDIDNTPVADLNAANQDHDRDSSSFTRAYSPDPPLDQSRRHGHHSRMHSEISLNHPPVDDYLETEHMGGGLVSIYNHPESTPDSAVSLTSDRLAYEDHFRPFAETKANQSSYSNQQASHRTPWLRPIVFALYLEIAESLKIDSETRYNKNTVPPATSATSAEPNSSNTHDLVPTHDLDMDAFESIDIHQLKPERFPGLCDLYQQIPSSVIFAKIRINLDLTIEGSFKNNLILESTDRQAIRCTTSIYSFGTKVLESTEVKQAAAVEERFLYSFQFVNQFFSAFLGGIQTLGSAEEVDMALSNLSILQVYEDLEMTTDATRPPLLAIAFDFEQGTGRLDAYLVTDGSELLETLVC
ncbi:Transcriptional enhancer factor TEF-1, partial [Gryganskiella cystojenkinii]